MPLASQRGKKKTNALQPAKGMTDEKGQRLLPLASQRGKKKTNALQPAKGMTDENIAFGESEGKKKTNALQLTKGMTEEKKKKNARAADARAFHRGIALV